MKNTALLLVFVSWVGGAHVLDQYTQEEQLEFAAYDTRLHKTDADSESADQSRETRDVEGSGFNWDDDEDGDYWNAGDSILPSRIAVPEPTSPVFSLPGGVKTSRRMVTLAGELEGSASVLTTARGPSRPDRLNSFYPGVANNNYEGSGVGPVDPAIVTRTGPGGTASNEFYDETDLISPTRPEQPLFSSIPPPQPDFPPANHQPFISNRLNKISLIAGKSSRIFVPANTFQDLEDGDTRDLKLEIVETRTGNTIDSLDWIQYLPETQEFIALPLESEIGTWRFRVMAIDSGGESVEDEQIFVVRQHSSSRVFHHSFLLNLTPLKLWSHKMEWKIEILEKIYSYFGDKDPSKISVLQIHMNQDDILFRWTNESVPVRVCPKQDILNMYNMMNNPAANTVSPGLVQAFQNDFRVNDVELGFKGLCKDRPVTSKEEGPAKLPPSGFDNSMPQIINPVDKLNVMAGELLQYQVPEDLCSDPENGKTRYLDLSLLTKRRLEVTSDNWLQFDKKNQEFYGVPLEGDVGREAYQLVCADSQGLMAIDGIEIHVVGRPFDERFNLEFVFVFNETLDDGQRLVNNRVALIKTIARIFSDPDTRHVVLKHVDPYTLQVVWFNKTIEDQNCPRKWLRQTKNFLLDKDNIPRQHVSQSFAPDFHLTDVKLVELGACVDIQESDPEEESDLPFFPSSQEEYILTFLVPALIIIAMLLLAILIACLLHRKKRAGKMDMFKPEALPPRIPVILQDELNDDNFNSCKQPIILREDNGNNMGPVMGGSMNTMGNMPGGMIGGYQQSSFAKPPNYYGSRGNRLEDEFSESESLVNGSSTMPRNMMHYSRPPPVSLEFCDSSLARTASSRHRPPPGAGGSLLAGGGGMGGGGSLYRKPPNHLLQQQHFFNP
jgi:dystroglycan 1